MKKISAVFLLFILSVSAFGQGNGWEWQNPKPQGNPITDIKFTSAQTGYALTSGSLLKTTDGGASWDVKDCGLQYIGNAFFFGTNLGWAMNNVGLVKTTDGGETWVADTIGPSAYWIHDLTFLNDSLGWAVGKDGKIFKTINGGNSWQNLSGITTRNLFAISILNPRHTWIVGAEGTLLHTANGGVYWQTQVLGDHRLNYVYFADSLHGWVSSTDTLYRTINGGNTWSKNHFDPTSGRIERVFFFDKLHGWAMVADKLIKTSDGGVTWSSGTDAGGSDIFFAIDENTGWLTTGYTTSWFINRLMKTENGGATWQTLLPGNLADNRLQSVCFPDSQHGWAVGGGGDSTFHSHGYIMQTSDGGSTWSKLDYGTKNLFCIQFIGLQKGWIAGDSGTLLRTTDGGHNWIQMASGTLNTLHDIQFINELEGWVIGTNGTILHTVNGGETWQTQHAATQSHFTDVFFLNSQNGWVIGGNGHYQTTDGGTTWTPVVLSVNSNMINSVFFRTPMLGWAAGDDDVIYKTTNGGATWIGVNNFNPSSYIHRIFFLDDSTGWAFGSGLLKTTDGGFTWTYEETPLWMTKWGAAILSNQEMWLVGGNLSIIHRSGLATPIHKTLVSPTFSIYPNPAEEYVNLQTHSPMKEITIVDAMGRTIETTHVLSLHENRLNISSLRPGIYFITIKTADGTAVQRVMKK